MKLRGDLVHHRQPARRGAFGAIEIRRRLVLHHVAGDQHAVRLDHHHFIAARMGRAEPGDAHRHAAQIQPVIGIEQDGGLEIRHALQQFLVLRRAAGENVDQLLAFGFQFRLLHAGAHQHGVRRKGAVAGGMLGMIMRGGQVKLLSVGGKLARRIQHDLAVGRAQSVVNNQGGFVSDHDADGGRAALDGPDMRRDLGERCRWAVDMAARLCMRRRANSYAQQAGDKSCFANHLRLQFPHCDRNPASRKAGPTSIRQAGDQRIRRLGGRKVAFL